MIKTLSVCCCAEIGKAQQMEFPLGGYRGIAYTINVCTDCGNEADLMELYCCDLCGETSEKKMFTCGGDDVCTDCAIAELEKVKQLCDEGIELIASNQQLFGDIKEILEKVSA